jgi:hypothetical protein
MPEHTVSTSISSRTTALSSLLENLSGCLMESGAKSHRVRRNSRRAHLRKFRRLNGQTHRRPVPTDLRLARMGRHHVETGRHHAEIDRLLHRHAGTDHRLGATDLLRHSTTMATKSHRLIAHQMVAARMDVAPAAVDSAHRPAEATIRAVRRVISEDQVPRAISLRRPPVPHFAHSQGLLRRHHGFTGRQDRRPDG